jgi:hypothetical protein
MGVCVWRDECVSVPAEDASSKSQSQSGDDGVDDEWRVRVEGKEGVGDQRGERERVVEQQR